MSTRTSRCLFMTPLLCHLRYREEAGTALPSTKAVRKLGIRTWCEKDHLLCQLPNIRPQPLDGLTLAEKTWKPALQILCISRINSYS